MINNRRTFDASFAQIGAEIKLQMEIIQLLKEASGTIAYLASSTNRTVSAVTHALNELGKQGKVVTTIMGTHEVWRRVR